MIDFYKRALALREETVAHRRYFHHNAEVGLVMPKACAYLQEKLKAFGLEGKLCGHGVTCEVGEGDSIILLRADMDALPMCEESGESFACPDNKHAHTCGHDLHAAMLLTAAKMLKECESALKGRVRFMFQPAEEPLEGCRDMIENGILAPGVDAALALHVGAGKILPGSVFYNSRGVMMSSADRFSIEILGKGGHAAYAHLTVDPIRIAVQIYLALESMIAKEAPAEKTSVLSIGKFTAGDADNVIGDRAYLYGSLRTDDKELQGRLVRRIDEIAKKIAALYGGEAKVDWHLSIPPLRADPFLCEKMVGYLQELAIPSLTAIPDMKASASEDFALVAEKVPSVLFYLSAGFDDERGNYTAHNPRVRFHEDVLPIGAAAYAHCAVRYLDER